MVVLIHDGMASLSVIRMMSDFFMNRLIKTIFFFICVFFLLFQCQPKIDLDQQLAALFAKKDVTILVTDSGLGGLSVVADLENKLPQSGIFENIQLVFFNALFHSRGGYNSLRTEAEKIRIFNIALEAMDKKYHPDLLLIACNTLSVLYHKTEFSKTAQFPVIGIVETGADLIAQQWEKNRQATAIIFGTQTTIESNSYQNKLMQRGYPGNQIIGQPCPFLTEQIEQGYNSDMTYLLISEFVNQAISQINNADTPIFASLNCTHYGYSIELFKKAFAEMGFPGIEIINPNTKMSNLLFNPKYLNRYASTKITVEVISKTSISAEKIESLGELLQEISPETKKALSQYQYDRNLFHANFDSTEIGL